MQAIDQINQLKEQIITLQQNEKDYQDLNFLFTNLEHRYNLLAEEKQRMEIDYNRRHEFNMQAVARHRAEIDQLRNEIQQYQNNQEHIEYVAYENQALTEEVNSLRDAYTKIVQQIQDQDEKYQKTLSTKQQYIESLQFQIKQMNDIQTHKEKKQQVENENKNHFTSEMESYKSQNEKLTMDNKQLSKQIERLETQIQNYKEQMNQMTQEIGKMQHQMATLTKELTNQNKLNPKEQQLEYEIKQLKNLNLQLLQKTEHQQAQIEQLIHNNQQLIIECDTLRIKLSDQESSKLLVQNQYAKSLNKFQEERKVIKDYLQRQKVLRETRLQNENDVSRCLEEITRINNK